MGKTYYAGKMRLLRIDDVVTLTAISKRQIYRLCARGDFPTRVQLSKRTVLWVKYEIVDWMSRRAARKSQGDKAA